MATALPAFPMFDIHCDSNLGPRWSKWLSRFERLMVALDISNEERKQALLLHYAGPDVDEIFDTLTFPAPVVPATIYTVSAEALTAHFTPKINTTFETFTFRQTRQSENETIDSFTTRLRRLAKSCDFADEDREIASQVILTCNSQSLRRRALREDLKLNDLIKAARAMELSDTQATALENGRISESVNAIRRPQRRQTHIHGSARSEDAQPNNRRPARSNDNNNHCWYCGLTLPHSSCPARGKRCSACGKLDHFARVCRSNPQQGVNTVQENVSEQLASDDGNYVYMTSVGRNHILSTTNSSKLPALAISILGVPVSMTIDSGATVNIINRSSYEQLPGPPPLRPPSTKVYPYGSNIPLPIAGILEVTFQHKNTTLRAPVHVVEGFGQNLLGCQTAQALHVLKIVQTVVEDPQSIVAQDFPSLFTGIGKIKNKIIKLHIDDSITPKQQPHRRIPFHVRKDVEAALTRLEADDIIEKIEGPTPWVSPIVVVPKKSGQVRICVDMREANKAIQREKHPMPTIDDLIADLNGATFFSTLDLSQGYHQFMLDPASRHITTFTTHKGLYRYKRLMFGINAASEIFQNAVSEMLGGLPGVRNISDDIIVYGKTQKEHERNLRAVLQRLQTHNARLNSSKCKFSQSSVSFFGHIFSKDGITADPEKIRAVRDAPAPSNVSEIRSLLGMAQYVARFIPDFASITAPLRYLTRQDSPWNWGLEQQCAVQRLINALTRAPTMAYFDPLKKSKLIVDASPHGLGAILTQDGQVVIYGSRALTDVESRYSQTEREMLAVVWGVEHFRLYLYGANCDVISDHKPLLGIFNSSKPASARIERWRIRLTPYSFNLIYQPGKDDANPADFISRHPNPNQKSDPAEEYVNYIIANAIPKAMSVTEVKIATESDPTLRDVIEAIANNNWGKQSVTPFKKIKDELSFSDGCILRGVRLIIPRSLQDRAINLAHSGHQGLVRTKQLIREKVWFPGIDKLAETIIGSCLACQATTSTCNFVPLQPSPLPAAPWERVSLDFLGPLPTGEMLLVVMDDYSRFPEVEITSSTASKAVIPKLDSIFARQGIPKILKSDNGPPFNGDGFAQFGVHLGFQHKKITPLWPRANGEVENFMKPLMKSIRAAHVEGKNWRQELFRFLRQYRATPHTSTGVSPAEALNGRKLRTTLPEISQPISNLKQIHSKIQAKNDSHKLKSKAYWDARHKAKPSSLSVGDTVLVKQPRQDKLSTPFDSRPLHITTIKGSMITACRGSFSITRNASHFKRYPISANHSETSVDDEIDLFDPLVDTTHNSDSGAQASNTPQLHSTPQGPDVQRRSSRVRFMPSHLNDYVR